MCLCYLFSAKTDNLWIERPIFLQNESIRIDSHNESNRIDSNRELECSSGWVRKMFMALRIGWVGGPKITIFALYDMWTAPYDTR